MFEYVKSKNKDSKKSFNINKKNPFIATQSYGMKTIESLKNRNPVYPTPQTKFPFDHNVEQEQALEEANTIEYNQEVNQTGIPDTIKKRFENLSDFSFNDVRVHYNSDRPAQLQALAYTQGNQIYIASGQERYLEHELGHVIQQKQGRVKPTINVNGFAINDDPELEYMADSLNLGYSHSTVNFNPESMPIQLFSINWTADNKIEDLKLDRPEINGTTIFREVEGITNNHVTAFVVMRYEIEKKLKNCTYEDALRELTKLTQGLYDYPGYEDLKEIGEERKEDITKQIEELKSDLQQSIQSPTQIKAEHNNNIEGYSRRYLILRNNLYYTFHMHDFGHSTGGGELKGHDMMVNESLNSSEQIIYAILKLFDYRGFDDNDIDGDFDKNNYIAKIFTQHMKSIQNTYGHNAKTIINAIKNLREETFIGKNTEPQTSKSSTRKRKLNTGELEDMFSFIKDNLQELCDKILEML